MAAKVPGVVKVVTLMEIITPEELERRKLIKENPSAVTEKTEVQTGAETIPIN